MLSFCSWQHLPHHDANLWVEERHSHDRLFSYFGLFYLVTHSPLTYSKMSCTQEESTVVIGEICSFTCQLQSSVIIKVTVELLLSLIFSGELKLKFHFWVRLSHCALTQVNCSQRHLLILGLWPNFNCIQHLTIGFKSTLIQTHCLVIHNAVLNFCSLALIRSLIKIV